MKAHILLELIAHDILTLNFLEHLEFKKLWSRLKRYVKNSNRNFDDAFDARGGRFGRLCGEDLGFAIDSISKFKNTVYLFHAFILRIINNKL